MFRIAYYQTFHTISAVYTLQYVIGSYWKIRHYEHSHILKIVFSKQCVLRSIQCASIPFWTQPNVTVSDTFSVSLAYLSTCFHIHLSLCYSKYHSNAYPQSLGAHESFLPLLWYGWPLYWWRWECDEFCSVFSLFISIVVFTVRQSRCLGCNARQETAGAD